MTNITPIAEKTVCIDTVLDELHKERAKFLSYIAKMAADPARPVPKLADIQLHVDMIRDIDQAIYLVDTCGNRRDRSGYADADKFENDEQEQ